MQSHQQTYTYLDPNCPNDFYLLMALTMLSKKQMLNEHSKKLLVENIENLSKLELEIGSFAHAGPLTHETLYTILASYKEQKLTKEEYLQNFKDHEEQKQFLSSMQTFFGKKDELLEKEHIAPLPPPPSPKFFDRLRNIVRSPATQPDDSNNSLHQHLGNKSL
jgi:hypothetical protein